MPDTSTFCETKSANLLDAKPPSQWTNLDLAQGGREPNVLARLAQFDDVEIRQAVAANPHTPDPVLAKLAQYDDTREIAEAAIRTRDEAVRRKELEQPRLVDDAFPGKVRVMVQVEHQGELKRSFLRDHLAGRTDLETNYATIAEARLAGKAWLAGREPQVGDAVQPTFLIVGGKGTPTEDEVLQSRTRVALAALPRSDFPAEDYGVAKAAFTAAHDRATYDPSAKAAVTAAHNELVTFAVPLLDGRVCYSRLAPGQTKTYGAPF